MPSPRKNSRGGFFHALLANNSKPVGDVRLVVNSVPRKYNKINIQRNFNNDNGAGDRAGIISKFQLADSAVRHSNKYPLTENISQDNIRQRSVRAPLSQPSFYRGGREVKLDNTPRPSAKAEATQPVKASQEINSSTKLAYEDSTIHQSNPGKELAAYPSPVVLNEKYRKKELLPHDDKIRLAKDFVEFEIDDIINPYLKSHALSINVDTESNNNMICATSSNDKIDAGQPKRNKRIVKNDFAVLHHYPQKPDTANGVERFPVLRNEKNGQEILSDDRHQETEYRMGGDVQKDSVNLSIRKKQQTLEGLQTDIMSKIKRLNDLSESTKIHQKHSINIQTRPAYQDNRHIIRKDSTIIGMAAAIKDLKQKYNELLTEKNAEKTRQKQSMKRPQIIKETVIKQTSVNNGMKTDAYWDRRFLGRTGIRLFK